MTVRALGDKVPHLAETAWVSEAAYVVGDVELGENSSVWPGAVVRGDFGTIRIAANTVVEDNCVVHAAGLLSIGENNIIGHSVVVHCARVGSNCLIGNHATLLDDAEIGDFCLVAAGAVVLPRTKVPDRSFVSGVPGTVEPISESRLKGLLGLGNYHNEAGYGMMARLYREAGL